MSFGRSAVEGKKSFPFRYSPLGKVFIALYPLMFHIGTSWTLFGVSYFLFSFFFVFRPKEVIRYGARLARLWREGFSLMTQKETIAKISGQVKLTCSTCLFNSGFNRLTKHFNCSKNCGGICDFFFQIINYAKSYSQLKIKEIFILSVDSIFGLQCDRDFLP